MIQMSLNNVFYSTQILPRRGGGDIDFGADPIGVSLTLSCLQNIF